MKFFSKILEKLGIGTPTATPTPVTPSAPTGASAGSATTAPVSPTPVSAVDVVGQLEQRARANSQTLNWRTSIVDLLKLLEMDRGNVPKKLAIKGVLL